ncbi:MAG TPA: outer membrane beta-barrel protein [Ignavibacteriales bacterium]|nr:outer membrane beta-barrel protein [Ignavibacteriales bacterium]
MLKKFFMIILFSAGIISAQEQGEFYLLAKAGVAQSSFGSLNLGGGSSSHWKKGPHFALGIEYHLVRITSFQLLAEYSDFGFDYKGYDQNSVPGNPVSRIVDLMANAKLNFGGVYLMAGLGCSYNHNNEVIWIHETPPSVEPPSKMGEVMIHAQNTLRFAGQLGIGLDIPLSRNISIVAEYALRFREDAGTAALAGMKFLL